MRPMSTRTPPEQLPNSRQIEVVATFAGLSFGRACAHLSGRAPILATCTCAFPGRVSPFLFKVAAVLGATVSFSLWLRWPTPRERERERRLKSQGITQKTHQNKPKLVFPYHIPACPRASWGPLIDFANLGIEPGLPRDRRKY